MDACGDGDGDGDSDSSESDPSGDAKDRTPSPAAAVAALRERQRLVWRTQAAEVWSADRSIALGLEAQSLAQQPRAIKLTRSPSTGLLVEVVDGHERVWVPTADQISGSSRAVEKCRQAAAQWRRVLMTDAHCGALRGHQGIHRTTKFLSESVVWKNLRGAVTRFISR